MDFRLKCFNWIGFLIEMRSIEEKRKEKFIVTIEICAV